MLEQMVAIREQPPVKNSVNWRVIVACQQGDRSALRTLFEAYKDRVYSIAVYSLGGDETAAADVTQQVFLKLMTRIVQFRGQTGAFLEPAPGEASLSLLKMAREGLLHGLRSALQGRQGIFQVDGVPAEFGRPLTAVIVTSQ